MDETVVILEYWYDPHVRSWCCQRKNKAGDQIGEALYAHRRHQIQAMADEEAKKHPGSRTVHTRPDGTEAGRA